MTQQGARQRAYRTWANTKLTFNGDKIAAGRVVSGIADLQEYNTALAYITRSISGRQDQNLANLCAAAAAKLGVPGGWDSVGDQLPLQTYDFTSGGTFPGLTYGTSVAGAISRDSLVYRASGEARTSSLGLLSERQITNKCTNTNLKPTDTTGTTPDGAWTTHEALPLASVPIEVIDALPDFTTGKLTAMYHSVSNAAGTIAVAGATGNINSHTPNAWVYVVNGDGGVGLTGQAPTLAPGTGAWYRVDKTLTPALATDTLIIGTTQASEIYWFGNQLEEYPARTSLIEVNGATATRLGDNVSTLTSSAMDVAAFTVVCQFSLYADPFGSNSRSIDLDNNANIGAEQMEAAVSTGAPSYAFNAEAAAFTGGSYTTPNTVTEAFGNDNGTLRAAVDGTVIGSGAFTAPASYPNIRFGSRPAAISQLAGYVKSVAIYDVPATQANVERLSTPV